MLVEIWTAPTDMATDKEIISIIILINTKGPNPVFILKTSKGL